LASSFPIEDWETGFYVVFIHTPKNYEIKFAAACFSPLSKKVMVCRQRILQSKILFGLEKFPPQAAWGGLSASNL
jgi:hypothetical protein